MHTIRQELLASHPADLKAVRHYTRWLRLRRQVNNYFYLTPQMHWVRSQRTVHWV
jgi:hypothetical protein